MELTDIKYNDFYLVEVSGQVVPVWMKRRHSDGSWFGENYTTFRTIRFKDTSRLIRKIDREEADQKRHAIVCTADINTKAIARVMAKEYKTFVKLNNDSATKAGFIYALRQVSARLADIAEEYNSDFDPDTFIKACIPE